MSSSLTLPAKIGDLSDTVIFDLETVREDVILVLSISTTTTTTKISQVLIKARNDTSRYILYCFFIGPIILGPKSFVYNKLG